MRVILPEGASQEGDVVPFTSAFASGKGRWCSKASRPKGAEIDVEIEIRGEIPWEAVSPESREVAAKEETKVRSHLRGVIEDVDHNGVVVLRVGSGIVMFETSGNAPLHIVGNEVSVSVEEIELFPIDY